MANRLANATSPYLLQHAENPVDWWEWGPDAFEEAKRRDTPILLSVGYAACHWCHVMAHESFEDPGTAAYLDEHFVSIKVDREERPDIDTVYMLATQTMTGQGGWPMTCVLDHDGSPFFAGTYFPDKPRHGQPAFRQVLAAIVEAWRERGDEVSRAAASVRAHLQRQGALGGEQPLDDAALNRAVDRLAPQYDAAHGGFGGAPKFPPSMVLEFLRLRGGEVARQMVDGTLEAMARGGIYDQLGGGFARYSVDEAWVVPHFEKMLYDNAQLVGLYARWGGPLGDRIARESADFLLRELRTPQAGFASALDADSEGEEGRFYVWTPGQLRDVLGEEDGAWAADVLQVTPRGTFEHGASTLQLPADPVDAHDAARLDAIRARLFEARADRVRPARDDKVVAAWNGLAISGLVEAGLLLGEQEYVDAAAATAELLREIHLRGDRLLRVSRDGVAGPHAGVLEDYGCVAAGFLALCGATADPAWLELAGTLLDTALAHFRAEDGGFYDTADDAEQLVTRPRDPGDNASPAGLSATVHALTTYAALTGSTRHREAAEEALASITGLAEQAPRFAGWSLAAAAVQALGPEEIAVVGPPEADRDALAEVARRRPGAVVAVADGPVSGIPLLDGRHAVDGRPAAYVCRHQVCAAPVTDPAALEPGGTS
ncbi:MAG: thioredoxin domain-containing protein [Nocardioides sp.]|uniref:thioredoxin domain-containing protein n=1 Tax=Nocardioides sp. TaxID=35761 RepID=UPI0039E2FC04